MNKKRTGHYLSTIICFLLLCLFYFPSTAQQRLQPGQDPKDTLKFVAPVKAVTKFATEDEIDRNISLHHIDTNPNGVELFHNLYKNYTVFQDLGNIGTPSRPLLFNAEKNVGFKLSDNPFEGYWMKPELTRYYNTKTPYSDFFYTQGSNELIYLKASHSQNILPRWNIGGDLQRITSIGFLARQYTSMYHFQFYTRYITQNKKYEVLANTTWNHGVVEESGGVASDSAFETLTGANKKVTPVLASSQTRYKGRTAFVKQYFHFGKLEETINGEDTIYDMKSNSQISLSTKFEEVSYIFENLKGDTNSLLLPNQYYDTTTNTFDSTYYGKIENRLAYDFFNSTAQQIKDSVRLYLSAGLTHAVIATSQYAYVRNYQNMIADITFEQINLKNYTLSKTLSAVYDFSGYNSGDYKAKCYFNYRLPIADIAASASSQIYKPDYSMLLFKSNQFIWNNENTFGQTKVLQLGLFLSTRKFRNNFHLKLNMYSLNNWVYANSVCIPVQSNEQITLFTAEIKKTFQVWKLYFDHYLIYQNSSSNLIQVPEVSGRLRYYFQSKFKTMKFQIGFDVFYNTAYYANAYNPATRMFFLQNDRLIGNYPLVDPFVSGEIKRAIIFAKYEHANQDLFTLNGYYTTPHYPISLSSFRFGVRWRFYD